MVDCSLIILARKCRLGAEDSIPLVASKQRSSSLISLESIGQAIKIEFTDSFLKLNGDNCQDKLAFDRVSRSIFFNLILQ